MCGINNPIIRINNTKAYRIDTISTHGCAYFCCCCSSTLALDDIEQSEYDARGECIIL
jgi:hypothetical protein